MSKGILRTVEGDVTNPQTTAPNEIVLIPHVCNNLGVMGAGVALALKNKWSEVEQVYKDFFTKHGIISSSGFIPFSSVLGKVCYAKIDNHLVIANMIGQDGIVSIDNPKPIKYKALADCMTEVVGYIEMIKKQTDSPVVIHACKFGSDLAGGDWNFILELIRENKKLYL